jgi:hypothetical protein
MRTLANANTSITQQLMRSPKHQKIWNSSSANKFGQLAQELKDGRVKGTNTILFICKDQVPKKPLKDVTYGSFSCDMKPNKKKHIKPGYSRRRQKITPKMSEHQQQQRHDVSHIVF